jgi:hypothetical protein
MQKQKMPCSIHRFAFQTHQYPVSRKIKSIPVCALTKKIIPKTKFLCNLQQASV